MKFNELVSFFSCIDQVCTTIHKSHAMTFAMYMSHIEKSTQWNKKNQWTVSFKWDIHVELFSQFINQWNSHAYSSFSYCVNHRELLELVYIQLFGCYISFYDVAIILYLFQLFQMGICNWRSWHRIYNLSHWRWEGIGQESEGKRNEETYSEYKSQQQPGAARWLLGVQANWNM